MVGERNPILGHLLVQIKYDCSYEYKRLHLFAPVYFAPFVKGFGEPSQLGKPFQLTTRKALQPPSLGMVPKFTHFVQASILGNDKNIKMPWPHTWTSTSTMCTPCSKACKTLATVFSRRCEQAG